MKIKVKKTKWPFAQKWHFVLVAVNGKTIMTSENYHNLADVYAAIRVVQTYTHSAKVYDDQGYFIDV